MGQRMSTLQNPAMEKMRRETLQNLQSTSKSLSYNSTRSYSAGPNLSQSKSTSAINIPASSNSLSTNNSCSMLSRSPKYYDGLNTLK